MLTLPVPLDDRQAARARLVDDRLRARVPELRDPFVATWEDHHRLVMDQGTPWLFCPLAIDPLRNRKGGYPLPDEVSDELRRIADAGAAFDEIALAHELDPGSKVLADIVDVPGTGLVLSPRDAAKALGRTPPPQSSVDAVRRVEEGVTKAGRIARRGIEGLAVTAVAIPAALAAAAATDPIIFGVAGIQGTPIAGRPVLYYPLAAWLW